MALISFFTLHHISFHIVGEAAEYIVQMIGPIVSKYFSESDAEVGHMHNQHNNLSYRQVSLLQWYISTCSVHCWWSPQLQGQTPMFWLNCQFVKDKFSFLLLLRSQILNLTTFFFLTIFTTFLSVQSKSEISPFFFSEWIPLCFFCSSWVFKSVYSQIYIYGYCF